MISQQMEADTQERGNGDAWHDEQSPPFGPLTSPPFGPLTLAFEYKFC
jgi:hypothetical protein